MKRRTAAQVMADATSALVQDHDVADTLARLLDGCAEVLSGGAVGLLVGSDVRAIELLSSTSHAMAELELFQIQQDTGPYIDAISEDAEISVVGAEPIVARWPDVGRAIVQAGYQSVLASPMRWHGQNLGALNAFFTDPMTLTKEQRLVAQAFADVATLVVMQASGLNGNDVSERIRVALAGRTVLELAKGVIAQQQGVDMPSAYAVLFRMASQRQTSLSTVAAEVVSEAQQRSLAN